MSKNKQRTMQPVLGYAKGGIVKGKSKLDQAIAMHKMHLMAYEKSGEKGEYASAKKELDLLLAHKKEMQSLQLGVSRKPMETVAPYPKDYALGGIVKGKGTTTSDSIPAKLSKDEAVLPAAVVKHLGKSFVKKLINMVPVDKGADTEVKDGVVHAAAGIDPDALDRINKITGVTGGKQASIPLPADQANAQLVAKQPTLQPQTQWNPDYNATKPVDPIIQKMGEGANYTGPKIADNTIASKMTQGAQYTPPKLDPYTGEVVKPSVFEGLGGKIADTGKAVGKGLVRGAAAIATDPIAVFGAADAGNQAIIEHNAVNGGLGVSDIPRLAFSAISRAPKMIAQNVTGGIADDSAASKLGQFMTTPIIGNNANAAQPDQAVDNVPAQATNTKPSAIPSVLAAQEQLSPYLNGKVQSPIKTDNSLGANGIQGVQPTIPKINLGDPGRAGQIASLQPQVTQEPYYTRGEVDAGGRVPLLNQGNRPVTTFNNGQGGSASVQFADGRTLDADRQAALQKTIERNADPAVQAKFAEQAKLANDRIASGSTQDAQPIQQQNPQLMQPQIPDYSEAIQGYLNQLGGGGSSDSIDAMIANKHARKAAEVGLSALLGQQRDAQNNAMQRQRMAIDQNQFNQRMAQAQTQQERDAIQQEYNNKRNERGDNYGILKDQNSAEALSKQNTFENDIKTRTLLKPQLGVTNTYADGTVNGQKAYAVTVDPKTGQLIKTNLDDSGSGMESLYLDALKTAHAEKDPKKRQAKLESANQAYQNHISQQQ